MYDRDKIIATLKEINNEARTIQPYVIIAQPRRILEEIPAQNFDGHDGLHIDVLGYSRAFANIGGEKVDVARNYLIEKAIESNAKYLLFAGEDTVIPYNGFLSLHKTAEANPDAVVVGVYYIKCSSPMIMVRDDNYITPADVTPGQVFEIHTSGLDCALIPIHILKQMKELEPDLPFCCIFNGDLDGENIFIGEDNFFQHRLRKHGFRLLVNTDVQCLHMDLASGKYTAHPDVNLTDYYTNIPITERLTLDDKAEIDKRWIDRLPEGSSN